MFVKMFMRIRSVTFGQAGGKDRLGAKQVLAHIGLGRNGHARQALALFQRGQRPLLLVELRLGLLLRGYIVEQEQVPGQHPAPIF
jgi:hypothetical protein